MPYADPVKQRAAQRRYYAKWAAKNPAKIKEYRRARIDKDREKHRGYGRKRLGLPTPLWPVPLLCEQCSNPPGIKGLALDHDHMTGKFRGWLCHRCNLGMGLLGDDIEGLRRAIAYLERANAI